MKHKSESIKYFFLLLFSIFLQLNLNGQSFTDSNLPIILINIDNNSSIPDEPKVQGTMKIIYSGAGQRNALADQNNIAKLNYSGRMAIEIRGSSSSVLNKKQYSLTTLMSDNITSNNVSLLGMPKEHDWILSGLAFDGSLMRDYLSFTLSRMLGQYAPRAQHCELFINGEYRGVYMLLEKIKADNNRVDILKINPADNALPELSGGYITKADKIAGIDVSAWTMPTYSGNPITDFVHEYPKPSAVTAEQNNYIHSVFTKLESISNNASITQGFPSVIDVASFIDFMIINELGSNADAYQFSTYFHKDRNAKLRAGPVWDLNLSYGYDLTHWGLNRSFSNVWQFDNGDNVGPKFWKDLYNNPTFRCYLSKRWNELTTSGALLNASSLSALIDQTATTLAEASAREYVRWQSDYSSYLLVANLSTQVTGIKNFINARIPWMTTQIGSASACSNITLPPLVISRINYNPAASTEFPNSNDQEFIEITNTGNETIDLTGIYFGETGFVYRFTAGSEMPPQTSLQLANNATVFAQQYGYSPYGKFGRNLSNSRQRLTLRDAFGNLIDEVEYSTDVPWPNADGNGYYLKLSNVNSDNNVGSNWEISQEPIASTITDLENKGIERIKIYPNPTEDYVVIESTASMEKIELTDMQGRLLEVQTPNKSFVQLDLRKFNAGLYIIKLYQGKNRSTHKLIKR